MGSWIKAVLISTGFVAVAMHLKVVVPVAVDFSRSPILLSFFLSWLKPTYLYVITNVIIIVIGVSSWYYRSISSRDGKDSEVCYSGDNKFQTDHQQIVQQNSPPRRVTKDAEVVTEFVYKKEEMLAEAAEVVTEVVYEKEEMLAEAAETVTEEKRSLVVVDKSANLLPAEKPLVSSRIGHRKPVKTTTAERNSLRALRVAKPRRHETVENTWKMITEGKTTPLTSYYRRPDTLGVGEGDSKKSDRSKYYLSPAVSRSRDELNGKVEAFIKKCNEDRFESMRQDNEVTRRGLSF